VLENIYRRFQASDGADSTFDLVADATAEAVRPVLFSVLVIIVALIPLFTMQGVPGKIFAPMSETYGFALVGATCLPSAGTRARFMEKAGGVRAHHTRLVTWLNKRYASSLRWTLTHRKTALVIAGAALVATFVLGSFLGGEFMPKLEEGNLWVRATLPQDVSYESSAKTAHDIREILLSFPVVTRSFRRLAGPTTARRHHF